MWWPFKKKPVVPHVHSPIEPVLVDLLRRDNFMRGIDISDLKWRCKCGKMVSDNELH